MTLREVIIDPTQEIQTAPDQPHESTVAVDLLRFTTAGSVDDGKSTLIGRLLADSGALGADQLAALKAQAAHSGQDHIDLAGTALKASGGTGAQRRTYRACNGR